MPLLSPSLNLLRPTPPLSLSPPHPQSSPALTTPQHSSPHHPPTPRLAAPSPTPLSSPPLSLRRRRGAVDFERLSPRSQRRVFKFCVGEEGDASRPLPPPGRLAAACARSFAALPAPDEASILTAFIAGARAAAAAAAAAATTGGAGGMYGGGNEGGGGSGAPPPPPPRAKLQAGGGW